MDIGQQVNWQRKWDNMVTTNHLDFSILPYSDKMKQLLKITYLVNEQNVSVMYIDINALLWCLDLR